MINLISDTVTRPSKGMLEAMMQAKVGDDVFRQDPTVNFLEAKVADMFGMEAALYCPSGTMTNQIALQVHCGRLEEVVCDLYSHIYQYETGGYAHNGGIPIKCIDAENGILKPIDVINAINQPHDWLPLTKLLVLENTCNKRGGNYYTLNEMKEVADIARQHGLKVHLDGARLFNMLVETGTTTRDVGELFDTISICLSKGLGAPVGSLLVGSAQDIAKARRLRKVMGGGMRQAGYMAAAGIYALDNNIERLSEDHAKAKKIANALSKREWVKSIRPVKTNILIFDLQAPMTGSMFVDMMMANGILCSAFAPMTVRLVTHLDVSAEEVEYVAGTIERMRV
jgi:threonine aldolase